MSKELKRGEWKERRKTERKGEGRDVEIEKGSKRGRQDGRKKERRN